MPAKGCFNKLEAGGACETVNDTFAIQTKDDAFITDLTCELGVCQ